MQCLSFVEYGVRENKRLLYCCVVCWPQNVKCEGFGGSQRFGCYHNWVPSFARPNKQWTSTLSQIIPHDRKIMITSNNPPGLNLCAHMCAWEREDVEYQYSPLFPCPRMPILCLQIRPHIPSLNRDRMHICVKATGNSNLFEIRFFIENWEWVFQACKGCKSSWKTLGIPFAFHHLVSSSVFSLDLKHWRGPGLKSPGCYALRNALGFANRDRPRSIVGVIRRVA